MKTQKNFFCFILILTGFLLINCTTRDKALEKRIVGFYKTQESQQLSKEEKIDALKEFILPGEKNDSMAHYFYNNWKVLNEQCKKLDTKILSIELTDDQQRGKVVTEDDVTYLDDTNVSFTSMTVWIKQDNVWFREPKKSKLFRDGERVR